MLSLALAALFWVVLHLVVAGPLRPVVAGRVGEMGYRGLFSLLSAAGLVWLALAYRGAPYEPLWPPAPFWVPAVLVFLGFVLLAYSLGPTNPTQVGAERLGPELPVAGITRITRHPMLWAFALWALAEIAILATDVAEVLGGALAIKLLLGLPLWAGILLTAFDMLLVVGLKGRGFRQVEAIVTGLVATIALCFLIELWIVPPDFHAVAQGLIPDTARLAQPGALAIAIGIIGATVMPHNLYLHSSIVQTREIPGGEAEKRAAIRIANWDSGISLFLAMLVNAGILALAAGAFHATGHTQIAEIDDAYHLLEPITGAKAAGLFFGIALLASGQSSTFTGTIAGQVILEGFLKLKIPCWQRRVIRRVIAIIPAMLGVILLGDHGVGPMLVVSQIVLSLQLPFAIWPLIRAAGDKGIMGGLAAGPLPIAVAWGLFAMLSAANLWLLASLAG